MECGRPAVAYQGPMERMLCDDCVDPANPPWSYICSVDGCRHEPTFLCALKDVDGLEVPLCRMHLWVFWESIRSFRDLPNPAIHDKMMAQGGDLRRGDPRG